MPDSYEPITAIQRDVSEGVQEVRGTPRPLRAPELGSEGEGVMGGVVEQPAGPVVEGPNGRCVWLVHPLLWLTSVCRRAKIHATAALQKHGSLSSVVGDWAERARREATLEAVGCVLEP